MRGTGVRSRSPVGVLDEVGSGVASSCSGPATGGDRQRISRNVESRGIENAAQGGADFRTLVANMFLKNKCSGPEIMELVNTIGLAGATGVEDLGRTTHLANAHRNILAKLLKSCATQPLHLMDVPLISNATPDVVETPRQCCYLMNCLVNCSRKVSLHSMRVCSC